MYIISPILTLITIKGIFYKKWGIFRLLKLEIMVVCCLVHLKMKRRGAMLFALEGDASP